MANYQAARAYYQRHADENTIRKIQNFLSSRTAKAGSTGISETNVGDGFYKGDLDGKFGPETFRAILEYQKAMGTNQDGMWGESTNSFHRVLNATNSPYRNDASGPTGGHASYVKGVNTGNVNKLYKNPQELYKAIAGLKDRYYSNGGDDWFWSDAPEAKEWRVFLQNTPQGREILNEFYDDAKQQGKNININKLTTEAGQDFYNTGISEAQNEAGKKVIALGSALSLPAAAMTSFIPTVLALGGGYLGGAAGRALSTSIHGGNTTGYNTNSFYYGSVPTAMPSDQYWAPLYETVGSTLGAIAGGALGSRVSLPTRAELNAMGAYRYNGNGPKHTFRSQYRNATGQFVNPAKEYAAPTTLLVALDMQKAHTKDNSLQKTWRQPSEEFINYMEGAGGNQAYTPGFTPYGFRNGGIIKRK